MNKKTKKKITAAILMAAIAITNFKVTANQSNITTETNVINAAATNQKTLKSNLEYTFKNLPVNSVLQNFFIDNQNNHIYATMVRKAYQKSKKKIQEDSILIKFDINTNNEAVAQSFLLIKNGGHGTSLGGYYDKNDNNKLKLYVGCNAGNSVALIDASILNQTAKNKQNINFYDTKENVWKNANNEELAGKTKIDIPNNEPLNFYIGNSSYYNISKAKKVIGLNKLCTTGKFDRADFVRASDGKAYVYLRSKVKVKQKDGKIAKEKHLQIIRLADKAADKYGLSDFDYKVASKNSQEIKAIDCKKAVTYNSTMQNSGVATSWGWQSEDVYMSSFQNRYFYLSTNKSRTPDKKPKKSDFIDNLKIKQLSVNGIKEYTYIINAVRKNNNLYEEEIEGITRIGKKLYFHHKITYKNGEKYTKVQTLQSVTLP